MDTQLLEVDGRDAAIKVTCEAGTYIRTLARDLGLLLGHPVKLKELRRTKSGRFTEPQAITLQNLKDAYWLWQEKGEDVAMRRILSPIESLVTELPQIIIKDGAAGAIAHGAPLMRPGIVSISEHLERGDTVRLMTIKGELVALASMLTRSESIIEMKEGEVAQTDSVFLPTDAYPRSWKKGNVSAE
jgi:H/ACA ribonucleoprotein complex subunit 4